MSSFIKKTRSLLAATCLCGAFAHSSIVQCQTATAAEKAVAAQQDQSAQTTPQPQTDAREGEDGNPAQDEQPISKIQMDGFNRLMNSRRCVAETFKDPGNPDKVIVVPAMNYSKMMGIRTDEVETMCAIFGQTSNKLFENDRDWQTFRDAYHHDHDDITGEHIPPELSAKMHEFDLQEVKIYEEAVAQLRQSLGEESFRKVAAWVEKTEKEEMRLQTEATLRAAQREAEKMKRKAGNPSPTQSEGDPGSEPTPVVPQ